MAESAALTGAFVNSGARHAYEMAAPGVAILPTGNSMLIRHVNQVIGQVAAFDSNVLILGESGTGKEVAARAIHQSSPRRARTFVPINCGAIPAELLESELFGHEKGAFTGALSARKGRFEIAEGGTIFLDEIGDMNPTMQVKLLRVLQERVFERVGSCVSQRCDVRIIAATHHNLEESIARGSFREGALAFDEKKNGLSEDERKRHETEVQKLTDATIADIDTTTAAKEKEILGK